nr:MspA family porin [Mycobacteroides salmoniphilum]
MRLVLVVAGVVSLAVIGTGTATAGLDDELTLVDGKGRTLRIQQWDTFLNGVFPLDRNRLTREWFHSGRAAYEVTGPAADTFEGTLELGYQVGYPWSLGVGLNFNYTTPNTSILYGIPNAFGGGPINVDLGNGPGIQEVATFSVAIAGPKGAVAVSNAHGTVTGAAGGVLLRPYARLISSAGDSVTTYGETWDMK